MKITLAVLVAAALIARWVRRPWTLGHEDDRPANWGWSR